MSVTDLVLWGLASGGGSGVASYGYAKLTTFRKKKANAPVVVDGRTHDEWYDLLKPLGREEFERLSRPALDGLEESEYGWDVKRLLGSRHHDLMKEWYPEKYCEFCHRFTDGKPGNCFWDGPCHDYQDNEDRKRREEQRKREAEIEARSLHLRLKRAAAAITDGKKPVVKADTVEIIKTLENTWVIKFKGDRWSVNRNDIKLYQLAQRLPTTGVMDKQTREAISEEIIRYGNLFMLTRKSNDRVQDLTEQLRQWNYYNNTWKRERYY